LPYFVLQFELLNSVYTKEIPFGRQTSDVTYHM
jgi:hypothetical protein